MARQSRGLSRNKLGEKINSEAHVIRALERTEVTNDADPLMVNRLAWALNYPHRFFREPLDPDIETGTFFACQNPVETTCACGKPEAPFLCDAPKGEGSCDTPCCHDCSRKRYGKDICQLHRRLGG